MRDSAILSYGGTWSGPDSVFVDSYIVSRYANQAAVLALGTLLEDGRTNDLFSIMSYTMFVVSCLHLLCTNNNGRDRSMFVEERRFQMKCRIF